MGRPLEDEYPAGAVHGLEGVAVVVDAGEVHVLPVFVPVAAYLPELPVEHDGGLCLDVARLPMDLLPVTEELVDHHHAVLMEEWHPRGGVEANGQPPGRPHPEPEKVPPGNHRVR